MGSFVLMFAVPASVAVFRGDDPGRVWRRRPAGGYAAPMSDPIRDPAPGERPDADRQPDLFDARGRTDVPSTPGAPVRRAAPSPGSLSDARLVGLLAGAGPSDIGVLCEEVVARSLPAAVPALEALWRRFHGFGIERPLHEQRAVLKTLARLGGPAARAALRRIVLRSDLPASLLPAGLRSAADAGLRLPAGFVAGFLGHDDPVVRGAAFELAGGANVPAPRLREGLSDRMAAIRRAAAVALAQRGDASGLGVLIAGLGDTPSAGIVEALGGLGGDEAIVALGRCAMRHRAFAPGIVALLREMDDVRAGRLAERLEAEVAGGGGGGV